MPLNNNTDVNGNRDAKNLLAQFAQMAATDTVGYVAVIACKEPNTFSLGYSGTVELEGVALEGLRKGIEHLETNIKNRTLPEPDPKLDASYVCYNVTVSPLSFDFVTWLLSMEQRRIQEGAPAPLKVGFWYGRDGKSGLSGMPERENMLNNVCRPALELVGAVEDPKAINGYNSTFFSYKMMVEAFNKGIARPTLKTDVLSPIQEPGYVTITLRECSYWPHRNSRMGEWMQFAKYLKRNGERVIFVRDTAKANEPIDGFETCPVASTDLVKRCALYQDAKANLFVANGPVNLGFFGDKPWMQFFEIDDQGAYNASTTAYWVNCIGLDPAKKEQFPWATKQQRLTWVPDLYTNMVLEWDKLWTTEETKINE